MRAILYYTSLNYSEQKAKRIDATSHIQQRWKLLSNHKTTECLQMKGVLDSIDNSSFGEKII